jgi:hypothetical protein
MRNTTYHKPNILGILLWFRYQNTLPVNLLEYEDAYQTEVH